MVFVSPPVSVLVVIFVLTFFEISAMVLLVIIEEEFASFEVSPR